MFAIYRTFSLGRRTFIQQKRFYVILCGYFEEKRQGKIAGSVYTNTSILSRNRECTNDGVLFEMKFKDHMVLVKRLMLQISEEKQSIIKAVSSNMLNKFSDQTQG